MPRAATPLLVLAGVVASGVWIEPVERRSEAVAIEEAAAEGGPRATPQTTEAADEDGAPRDPEPSDLGYRCRVPDVPIERKQACDEGLPYPACKWQLPRPYRAGRTYRVWRNTVEDHLWARPSLIGVVLGTAAEYARHYPGQVLAVGDLDAPGPRHETHDGGVDVDLYLPGSMEIENLGGGEYSENYRGLDRLARRTERARVETLARILATCTQGRLRIYYNDDDVRRRFLHWFEARGFASPFGRPMQKHNDLHRFHFHVTVPKDLPLPAPEGPTS